jgi:uncharacterized protein (TIGR03086 family)
MNELSNASAAFSILRQVVDSIDGSQLALQTPCRDYDIAALAEHLIGSITRISAAAGVVVTPSDDPEVLRRLDDAGAKAVTGWRSRGVDGDVEFAGRTLPARALLSVIALEFVVHGWDFAVPVGAALAVPEDLAGDILAVAQRTITPASRRLAGFDEPVAIGDDANALGRLLAFTGRDPALPTLLR